MPKKKIYVPLVAALTVFFVIALGAVAVAETAGPTIASDQLNYAAGETVILTGSGWQAGESVHIRVNDDEGETWRYDKDVVADGEGGLTDSFQLPDWFVAVYTVTATGAVSGSVTTTFTDAAAFNIAFASSGLPAGTSVGVTYAGTNNGGQPVSGTVTFLAPGPSGNTGLRENTSLTFGFPATLSPTGQTCTLASASQTSPYTTGAAGEDIAITGTYTCVSNDTTPPVISYVLTPSSPDALNTWYKSNVTLVWTVTETESPGSLVKTGCVDQNITADQDATTYPCSATSTGGSSGPVNVTIRRDATAPGITWSSDDISNGGSFEFGSVPDEPTCTATDGRSGPGTCGVTGYGTTVGSHTLTATAYDLAGNSTTETRTYTVADTTDPVVDCTPVPDNTIWYGANVTVNCTASDPSGLKVAGDATFSVSTSVAAGNETASAQTGPKSVCDIYDNCVDVGPFTFKIDRKAPAVSCGSADSIWHAANQDVLCTATDGGSGPATQSFTLSTSVADGTETDSAYTGSHTFSDNVGNTAGTGTVGPFKIDRKAPAVSCGSADSIWHAANQDVLCTATDGGSGPATQSFTLSTSVADGTETDSAYTGSHTFSDNVGNTAGTGTVGPFKIDRKAPTISITSPTATTYVLNQTVAAGYTCSDGGSGVASCAGTVASGSNINTSSVGSKTFTVNATDNVGNAAPQASVTYNVAYNFFGFTSPVDNPGVLNTAKAGQAIPLKWRLLDATGAPVTNLSSVKVTVASLSCSSGVTSDLVEEYATGASGLQNLGDGYYQFNWKTPTSYASSCKTMKLDMGEGVGFEHTALFQFKK